MSDKDNILDFKEFKRKREEAKKQVEESKDDATLNDAVLRLIGIMDKQDQLVQMLIDDMVSVTEQFQRQHATLINTMSSFSALLTVLERKGIVSHEECAKVWEEEYLPLLKGEAPKAPSLIIPPDGTFLP